MSLLSERASLLSLPPELRLRIYDYAIHDNIACQVLQDIKHTSDAKNGTQAVLVPKEATNLSLSVPWVNLRLSCRTIASELEDHMNEVGVSDQSHNKTYTLDVLAHNDDVKKAIRSATWRTIPCMPSVAANLVLNFSATSNYGPWTEGGPASLARAIYQIVNYVCHNGPLLVTRQELKEHMRFRELIINVNRGSAIKREGVPSGCDSNPEFNYHLFENGMCQLARKGYLFGYVETVKLRDNEDNETEYSVEDKPDPTVSGAWRNYGFAWGV